MKKNSLIFAFLLGAAFLALPAVSHAIKDPDSGDDGSTSYAVTVSFVANPATIASGSTSVLTWSSTNATSCTLYIEQGSVYDSLGTVATSSSYSVSDSVSSAGSGQYAITCDGTGSQATEYATVTITPPPLTASLSATQSSITQGSSTTLKYACTGSTLATIDNGVGLLKGTEGSVSVSPTTSTTYTLTCTGENGGTTTTTGTWVFQGKMNIADDWGSAADVAQADTLPDCPSSDPTGTACTTTGSDECGNYSYPGDDENVATYECEGSSTTKLPTATDSAKVTVTAVPAPTVLLTASPTSIISGASSKLTWSSTNANSCSAAFTSSTATSGTATVSPTRSTTYSVTCTGAGGSKTATATVAVTPVLTGSCSVSPTSETTGQTVTWTAVPTGGTGTYTYAWTASGGSPSTATSDTLRTSYAKAGTYGAKVVLSSGGQSATITCKNSVTVTLPPAPTVSLTATPSSITAGQSSTLKWSSTNANSCSAAFTTSTATSGTKSVSPATSTTYSVTCTGAGGSKTATATVTVTAPANNLLAKCSVSPATATIGKTVTWTATPSGGNGTYTYAWSSTGASPSSSTKSSYATTYATAGTYTASVTISSGGQSSKATPCTNSIVVSPQLPDLTAGAVTPDTATVNTPVTFSATASNIGNASSGTFPSIIEINNSHTTVATNDLSLAKGANALISAVYTFTAVGTYQVRACANMNTSMTNIVTESNYGNNCGPWTTVTVTSASSCTGSSCTTPPACTGSDCGGGGGPSVSCEVNGGNSAITVSPSQSVTYTAEPSDGASGPYAWTASDGTHGFGTGSTATRTLAATGTYGMQVSATGATSPGFCPNVTVSNGGPGGGSCNTAATSTISADPNRVEQGDTSSLTYSASGITPGTTCTISGPGIDHTTAAVGDSCVVPGNTITTPPITAQSTYTITCTGTTASTVINVVPKYNEF